MPGSRFPRHAEASPAHTPRRGVATEHLLEGSGRGTLKCKGETEAQDMGKGAEAGCHQGRAWPPDQQASSSAQTVSGGHLPQAALQVSKRSSFCLRPTLFF